MKARFLQIYLYILILTFSVGVGIILFKTGIYMYVLLYLITTEYIANN